MLAIKILSPSASWPGLANKVLQKGAGNRAPFVYAQRELQGGRESERESKVISLRPRRVMKHLEVGSSFLFTQANLFSVLAHGVARTARSEVHIINTLPSKPRWPGGGSHSLDSFSFPAQGLHVPFCNTMSIQSSGQMFARFKGGDASKVLR